MLTNKPYCKVLPIIHIDSTNSLGFTDWTCIPIFYTIFNGFVLHVGFCCVLYIM